MEKAQQSTALNPVPNLAATCSLPAPIDCIAASYTAPPHAPVSILIKQQGERVAHPPPPEGSSPPVKMSPPLLHHFSALQLCNCPEHKYSLHRLINSWIAKDPINRNVGNMFQVLFLLEISHWLLNLCTLSFGSPYFGLNLPNQDFASFWHGGK